MLGPGLMRLAGPLIAPPLFRDACLYLDFTSGVYADAPAGVLSRRRSFEDLVTFTSLGARDGIGPSLQFEIALAGQPRFMHDPAGSLPRGIAVEPSETRLNPNAENMAANGGFRTSSAVGDPGPFGATSNFTLFEVATADASNGSCASSQPYSLSAGRHTVAVYAKAGPDQSGWLLTRPSVQSLFSDAAQAFFDPVTGTKGAAVLASGASVITGVSSWIEPQGGGVYRCFTSFTLGSNADIFLRHYIAASNGALGSDLGDQIQLWGAQLVSGSTTGSFIRGNTPNTVRPAESLTAAPLHGGGSFTILADFSVGVEPNSGFPRLINAFRSAVAPNDRQGVAYSGGNFSLASLSGGATRAGSLALKPWSAGRHLLAASFTDDAFHGIMNGGSEASRTGIATALPSVDSIAAFADPGGVNSLLGPNRLHRLVVFPTDIGSTRRAAFVGAV